MEQSGEVRGYVRLCEAMRGQRREGECDHTACSLLTGLTPLTGGFRS